MSDNFADVNVPSVFDRADGGWSTNYGTPTPPGTLGINFSNGAVQLSDATTTATPYQQLYNLIFEESSDSPTIEFGEQCTITHTFFMDALQAQETLAYYQRGFIMYDNTVGPLGPNVSRVLSTNAQPIARYGGLVWRVSITSEAQSFANPPDEISYDVVELNPAAEKHPRYSALTYAQRNIVRNADVSDFIDIQQQCTSIVSTFPSSSNQWANQQGQSLELLYKKQKGEDSFYLSGYKIQYSRYFWGIQDINPGGYIEDPFTVIPYQYYTDADSNNIFYLNATQNANLYPNNSTNPLDYPYGISWLRQTDTQVLNRTWWKFTQTWIGGTLAQWDKEWYSPTIQPLQNSASYGSILLA